MYCSWLERLLGMLGRPRPTTGEEVLEGEAASLLSLPPGCRRASAGRCGAGAGGRAMKGASEGGSERASERAPSKNEGLHPSKQHREGAQQLPGGREQRNQHSRRWWEADDRVSCSEKTLL